MAMSRSGRIITLLVIDTLFFFLEIIVGYAVHSLALVADSFHMLNDVFSLLVALWAIKLSKQKSTSSYTYGWQRAEVLGALINGVFLLALCLSIFLEAIQRFFEPQTISNPILILVVGSCGLASNFVGLALFHDHGHAHPTPSGEANGHGAATPDVEVGHTEREHQTPLLAPDQSDSYGDATTSDTTLGAASGSHKRARSHSHSHSTHHHSKPKPKAAPQQNLNMRGVFLHVMGDALGNIGVISTALFIWKTDYWWRWYFDPAVSLFITAIIFASALPLVKSASKILLQAVPKGISLEEVKADILSIKGVESVHELHIWQLSDVKMIASLHIQIAFDPEEDDVVDSVSGVKRPSGQRYMKLARAIRTCLHAYGIHSSTIQPEYTPKENGGASGAGGNGGKFSEASTETECLLECGEECGGGKCCGPMVVSEGHGHAH
ncbi:cation efflux protein [Kalaharituber pfeilii]|nr:cation efflux protein [Kalaharituber pfeilii]